MSNNINTLKYVNIQVNTIISEALQNTREQIAIKSLKNTSFKDIINFNPDNDFIEYNASLLNIFA